MKYYKFSIIYHYFTFTKQKRILYNYYDRCGFVCANHITSEKTSYFKKGKKMKKIRYFSAAVLCVSLMSTSVFASDRLSLTKDKEPRVMNIEIKTSSNENVLFQVVPQGTDISNISDSAISSTVKYYRSVDADDKGIIKFGFQLNGAGAYTLYSRFENDETVKKNDFYYATKAEYQNIIDRLNLASDNDDFYAILSNSADTTFSPGGIDNLKALGFKSDLSDAITLKNASDMLYNSAYNLDRDDTEKNMMFFNACVGIEGIIEDKSSNVFPYLKNFLGSDTDFADYTKKHINTENEEKYFTQKLKSEMGSVSVAKPEDIIPYAKKALVLTAVRFPEGAGANVYEIMNKFSSVLPSSILPLRQESSIYNELKGNDYESVSGLESAYNTIVAALYTLPGSDNAGNNTSVLSGGTGSISSGASAINIPQNNQLGLKFEDLDGVDWAYSAISELFEKGIVSGYSDFKFKPNDSVKREEFVKMIVCCLNLENENYQSSFQDVTGDWSEKYVSIAYKHKLVNGISGDLFGKGREIARQDMAVMVYNALLSRGYVSANADYNFNDECSDYARIAISELSAIGVINGVGDGYFDPHGVSTRAQAAVIISRALKNFDMR